MLIAHMRKLDYLHLMGLVDIIRLAPRLLALAFRTNGKIVWDGGASVGGRSPTLDMTLDIVRIGAGLRRSKLLYARFRDLGTGEVRFGFFCSISHLGGNGLDSRATGVEVDF